MRGKHTWDIVHDYLACPSCGYAFDDRQPYTYRLGDYVKEAACPRCHHTFEKKKVRKPKFGPLWG